MTSFHSPLQPGNPPQRGPSPFQQHGVPQRGPSPFQSHPPLQRGTSPFQPGFSHSPSPHPDQSPLLTPTQLSSRPSSPAYSTSDVSIRKAKRHYPQSNMGNGQVNTGAPPPPMFNQAPQPQPTFQQPQPSFQQPQPSFQQPQPSFQQPQSGYQHQNTTGSSPSPYPQQLQQQQQQYPSQPGFINQNEPVSTTSYQNSYQSLANGMANISLQPPPRDEVHLVGQPPRIHDLDRSIPSPILPPNITATPSANAQCPSHFNRCTLNAVPYSNTLLKKSKLPFALILEPYLSDIPGKNTVPLIEDTIVSRCTRCKTYINPFVRFTQGAFKWQCNMCGLENDVPQEFDWDVVKQQQADRWNRAELNYGCVDFVAPADYMLRPPQPPVYVFVLDTSFQAIQSGMLKVVADAILQSLDSIPNEDGRTQVAFISADNAIAFYKLVGEEPEALVVGDLDDIYLPRAANDLVVNLGESRQVVEDLLNRMKTMFDNSVLNSNCLGSALQAAKKLLSPTGGKIICFQASLPNVGEGILKPTPEQKSVLDSALMSPSNTFYRTFATECTKTQVCADMFIFGSQHSDVATLNVIPRFTGGQTHFFPGYNGSNQADNEKIKQEIMSLLGEKIGLEAVMRTRCSSGLICKSFYGNCTVRSPDIMALPNVPRGQSYCIEIGIEEEIQSPTVYFQTALLYTTCFGERRIRVMNLCLPVTKSISDMYTAVDQFSIARALCHQAIDKAATNKLREGRDLLWKSTAEICNTYGKEMMGSSSNANQMTVCRELGLLPLLVLGLLKTETFNELPTIPVDIRSQTTLLLRTLPIDTWVNYIQSNFYALHSMPPQAGTIDPQTQQCILPPRMNLSSEKLEPHGCYLIENGQSIYIWIGKSAVPALCKDLLNVSNINEIQSGQVTQLPVLESMISQRLSAIINQIQQNRQVSYYPSIYIVREDGDLLLRSRFLSLLIEDRQPTGPTTAGANQKEPSSSMSYFQWLGFLRSKN